MRATWYIPALDDQLFHAVGALVTRLRAAVLSILSAGLGAVAAGGLRLLDSRAAVLAVAGAGAVLGVALTVDAARRVRRGKGGRELAEDEPSPVPSPRRSLHAELVDVREVPRERRRCARCCEAITIEREGDRCWISVRQIGERTALVHLHRGCADVAGEPLP